MMDGFDKILHHFSNECRKMWRQVEEAEQMTQSPNSLYIMLINDKPGNIG